MRSIRFEPGAVARHASDLAGHCQRCPGGFYRGNCDGGGSSSESADVDNTTNGVAERQDNNDVKIDEASGDAGAASLLSDDAGVEDAVQPADANYTSNYSHIRRTNLLLKNAESYATPSDIAQYVGEAKFFRAYSYFDLLQLYGNAILVKEPMEVTDARMYVKQNDRSEVADFIIKDLKEAVPLLPKFSEIQEYGRISREGCQAFLSRVALYEGTWQKSRGNVERGKELLDIAAKAAKDVIDSKTFSLFKPEALGDSAQKYMFILEDAKSNPAGLQKSANKEYIFARRFDEILAPINWNITQSSLYNAIWISRKFANMYLCQNGLPITYGGKTNPQFKGYMKIDDEFQDRDNRMRYTMMRPHDNF